MTKRKRSTNYSRADLRAMVKRYVEAHPQVSLASAIVDAMVTENRALLPQRRELHNVAENLLSFT